VNFYNPLINILGDSSAPTGLNDYESIAEYHIEAARGLLDEISKTNPQLAELIAGVVFYSLLAANAYTHDIFEKRNPTNEDFETRIRKNR